MTPQLSIFTFQCDNPTANFRTPLTGVGVSEPAHRSAQCSFQLLCQHDVQKKKKEKKKFGWVSPFPVFNLASTHLKVSQLLIAVTKKLINGSP